MPLRFNQNKHDTLYVVVELFTRHDSELIRESVCACAKLSVDEESTLHKSNRGIEQKH
jgi:hypothetical protein